MINLPKTGQRYLSVPSVVKSEEIEGLILDLVEWWDLSEMEGEADEVREGLGTWDMWSARAGDRWVVSDADVTSSMVSRRVIRSYRASNQIWTCSQNLMYSYQICVGSNSWRFYIYNWLECKKKTRDIFAFSGIINSLRYFSCRAENQRDHRSFVPDSALPSMGSIERRLTETL